MAENEAQPSYWEFSETLVTEAWAEKRKLADCLRELVSLCVATDAPKGVLESATLELGKVRDRLKEYPGKTFREHFPDLSSLETFAVFADRATLVGRCNPIAPPMKMAFDGRTATAKVTFGIPFEGGPGLVHGGLIAAAFDQTFGYLTERLGTPGLTRKLTVHYDRPTPLLTELLFTAYPVRSEGKYHYVASELTVEGKVTARAEGVFVALENEAFRRIFEGVPHR